MSIRIKFGVVCVTALLALTACEKHEKSHEHEHSEQQADNQAQQEGENQITPASATCEDPALQSRIATAIRQKIAENSVYNNVDVASQVVDKAYNVLVSVNNIQSAGANQCVATIGLEFPARDFSTGMRVLAHDRNADRPIANGNKLTIENVKYTIGSSGDVSVDNHAGLTQASNVLAAAAFDEISSARQASTAARVEQRPKREAAPEKARNESPEKSNVDTEAAPDVAESAHADNKHEKSKATPHSPVKDDKTELVIVEDPNATY